MIKADLDAVAVKDRLELAIAIVELPESEIVAVVS